MSDKYQPRMNRNPVLRAIATQTAENFQASVDSLAIHFPIEIVVAVLASGSGYALGAMQAAYNKHCEECKKMRRAQA